MPPGPRTRSQTLSERTKISTNIIVPPGSRDTESPVAESQRSPSLAQTPTDIPPFPPSPTDTEAESPAAEAPPPDQSLNSRLRTQSRVVVTSSSYPGRVPNTKETNATRPHAAKMKKTLKDELINSVYHESQKGSISSVFLRLPTHLAQFVKDQSKDHAVRERIYAAAAILQAERKAKEEKVYEPFLAYINTLLSIFKSSSNKNITQSLRRKLVAVNTSNIPLESQGMNPLKPDGALAVESPTSTRTKQLANVTAWSDVIVAVEVKGRSWGEIFQRSSVYARCLFANPSRWFAPVIGYRQDESCLRFFFFTRAGVYVTADMDVKQDWALILSILGRLMSLSRERIGFDDFIREVQGKTRFYLPNGTGAGAWYQVETDEHWLAYRHSLRGRATQVAIAIPLNCVIPPDLPQHHESLNFDGTPIDDLRSMLNTLLDSNSKKQVNAWERGYPFHSWSIVSFTGNVPEGSTRLQPSRGAKGVRPTVAVQLVPLILPDKNDDMLGNAADTPSSVVIAKSSWQLLERITFEYAMLKAVQGQHGFPKVSFCVVSRHCMPLLESLDVERWDDTSIKDYYSEAFNLEKREKRAHTLMMLHTEALLDVVIALQILYSKGWMHRDISNGNILVAAQEQTYSTEKLPSQIKGKERLQNFLGKFRGFVIDGDVAVKYKEPREYSYHRSGTFPFISTRVLQKWEDENLEHTVLNDLDSVTWVLLFEILDSLDKESLREQDKKALRSLVKIDIQGLADSKESIRNRFDSSYAPEWPDAVLPYMGPSSLLFSLAVSAETELRTCFGQFRDSGSQAGSKEYWEKLDGICNKYFEMYLDVMIDFVEAQ